MRRPILATLLCTVAVSATAAPQGGPDKDRTQDKPAGKGKPPTVDVSVRVFTDGEKAILREYYGRSAAKSKPLPPGIAKNLARGKPLPPGIAKQALPRELLILLPERPGYQRLVVGDVVVLVDAAGLVTDLVAGLFR